MLSFHVLLPFLPYSYYSYYYYSLAYPRGVCRDQIHPSMELRQTLKIARFAGKVIQTRYRVIAVS